MLHFAGKKRDNARILCVMERHMQLRIIQIIAGIGVSS